MQPDCARPKSPASKLPISTAAGWLFASSRAKAGATATSCSRLRSKSYVGHAAYRDERAPQDFNPPLAGRTKALAKGRRAVLQPPTQHLSQEDVVLRAGYRRTPRRRSALPMTDTELSDIASAATIGLSNRPKAG